VGLARPCLEAHDLYRFYHAGEDETLALRGVTLTIHPSETVAIVGPSGSGKSTLLHCLAGLEEPDGGWVAVMGERMTRRPERQRAALRARYIGILLQSGNLIEHLNVLENLTIAAHIGSSEVHAQSPLSVLDAVGVGGRAASLPAQLSGGELARAGLAVALVKQPAILIADEPTGEVDATNEALLLELLRQRAHDGGANLIVTHSPAVAGRADRVLRLVDGMFRDD
jgi:putative ABC transport system ATP-binding protein